MIIFTQIVILCFFSSNFICSSCSKPHHLLGLAGEQTLAPGWLRTSSVVIKSTLTTQHEIRMEGH